MKLEGKPGFPPWLNRLAHFVCCWLVGGVLSVAFLMWWRDSAIKESLESLGVGAVLAAVSYAIGLAIYLGRRRKTS
jgi:hypothetical protein